MTRTALFVASAIAALAFAAPSHATLNACASAKKACVAKKTAALLKCHSKAEKPPGGMDPQKFATCLQKAKDKFDGGANPAKGCFAKLETKYSGQCLTTGDTAALEAMVDAYVDAVVCAIDPAGGTCPTPTPVPTSTPSCTAIGQLCAVDAQCCSTSCVAGQCAPSCVNGQQDGIETGVDCGGSCPDCPLGGGCAATSDCVATTVCSAGQCVCAAGQSNCNVNPADGCEATTATDVNNCGGCNNQCPVVQNGTAACQAAQCTIGSCNAGYSDCDANLVTGCEVNVASDSNNCGFCGNVCPLATNCIGGICQ